MRIYSIPPASLGDLVMGAEMNIKQGVERSAVKCHLLGRAWQLHPDLTRVMATCARSNQKDQWVTVCGGWGRVFKEVGSGRSWGAANQDTSYTCTELVKTTTKKEDILKQKIN